MTISMILLKNGSENIIIKREKTNIKATKKEKKKRKVEKLLIEIIIYS